MLARAASVASGAESRCDHRRAYQPSEDVVVQRVIEQLEVVVRSFARP
jgi:hypothetical protein